MSTYLIGDVHGCYHELQSLLEVLNYNPTYDRLGFVGDLVNRGQHSLEVLRFVKSLKDPLIVLGNHDLYLLALAYRAIDGADPHVSTMLSVLNAKECDDLIEWLRHLPLMIYERFGVITHAGVPPQWSLAEAHGYAREIEAVLQGTKCAFFLSHLLGDVPNTWGTHWSSECDRYRYIVNALTRMRYCTRTGTLDLFNKTMTPQHDEEYRPWFEWYHGETDIFFGHWAALKGKCDHAHVHALDAACVYGGSLKAICLETKAIFQL